MTYFLEASARGLSSGRTMCNNPCFRLCRNRHGYEQIFGPAVCYYSYERLPNALLPQKLMEIVPDLVVEVHPRGKIWLDSFAKMIDYLNTESGWWSSCSRKLWVLGCIDSTAGRSL